MPTRIVSVHTPEPDVIAEAAAHLRAGRLVAFPTETVYGLGAHAMDPVAVARIYAAKGRPAYNPLIVHIAAAHQAGRVAAAWPRRAALLAEAFWPGPVTIVVPRRSDVPDAVTAGLGTVAVRVPAHPVARALLEAAGFPVAAPSANRSTELSPTTAAHVARALGDSVAMILDAGPTSVGIESTVVDVSGPRAVLLRPGGVSRGDIESVIGEVDVPAAAPVGNAARASPGQMDRHYAPRARLVLFDAVDTGSAVEEIARARAAGKRTCALVARTNAPGVQMGADEQIAMPPSAAAYARELYAVLHELDARGVDLVAVELPPPGDAWEGVLDRLRRATPG